MHKYIKVFVMKGVLLSSKYVHATWVTQVSHFKLPKYICTCLMVTQQLLGHIWYLKFLNRFLINIIMIIIAEIIKI